ncbi:MAG TPA: hypothetical protein ENJ35_06035 [Gammaproteobacteria bacterium]|nr:hypothetical protein [Gammaproteobacteria bacterium]
MALTREQSLREAIAHEETRLAELTNRRDESQRRLAELKQKLASIVSAPAVLSDQTVQSLADGPTTAEEKIRLFRQLFRGRDDVYPKLWISTKTGRKGYSPACGNDKMAGKPFCTASAA